MKKNECTLLLMIIVNMQRMHVYYIKHFLKYVYMFFYANLVTFSFENAQTTKGARLD